MAVAVAATGCQSDAQTHPQSDLTDLPPSATKPVAREDLADGGTLRWGINEFPGQWNPHHANGNLGTVETVLDGLLPSPFRTDAEGQAHPDPDYVEEVAVQTEPEQTVTLRLNPDARWSTGDPITWYDYAAMVGALAGENSGHQILGEAGYERISDVSPGRSEFEVVITFERPFADYASLFRLLLPADYTETPEGFNEGYAGDIPVTAGPFEVGGIDRTAQTITLVRNDDWWGAPARLDRIIYRSLAPEALDAAFLDGGIDVYTMPIDPGSYERISGASDGEIRAALAPDYRHITLNGQSPGLSDVDVRHAIFLAIDRRAIAESAFSAMNWSPNVLDNHFLLANQEGYADNSGAWGEHDPERAAELLEEAGWALEGEGADAVRTKDGEPLALRFTVPQGYAPALNEAELVQAMLGEVGIGVEIESVPGDHLFSDYIVPGNYDMVSFVNNGSGFPVSQSLLQWSDATVDDEEAPQWRGNVGRIGSPEIDAAMTDAMESLDPSEAIEHINEADRLLWEAGHTLPLYQRPELVAVRGSLANIGAPGFGRLDYADIGFTG
ncbi:peptide/nickel transport system substrate-binding protein [Spinactinospora alkalitolerans]|uniref:Peptide/nickel transport system substrate-binding protein n=1 Tax=Spinactinospora alkalitolerans TaxID=687207 RepID=A0A852U185_9ACTN|nr:peptide/nickel transport system substrate-binding protein [Spinactinospora alkalitolerans]